MKKNHHALIVASSIDPVLLKNQFLVCSAYAKEQGLKIKEKMFLDPAADEAIRGAKVFGVARYRDVRHIIVSGPDRIAKRFIILERFVESAKRRGFEIHWVEPQRGSEWLSWARNTKTKFIDVRTHSEKVKYGIQRRKIFAQLRK